jgi:integrase
MASFQKRGDKWRAQIFIDGRRKSKSFPTKAHAQAWVTMMERQAADHLLGSYPNLKVKDLALRYMKEVSPTKDGEKWEVKRLNSLLDADPLAQVRTQRLSETNIAEWRDRRLKSVSGSTVNREWNLLSSVFSTAVKEWKWLKTNPMSNVKRPKSNNPRSRRPSSDEIDRILLCLNHHDGKPETLSQRVALAILFAMETAIRAGEICKLEWKRHVREKTLHLTPDITKSRRSRDVPLSKEARRVLNLLPQDSKLVFNLKSSQLDSLYRKARDKALVDGLNFHDLRREALTRLSEKVEVLTLAKISGHADLRILKDVYYAPKMDKIADILD